MTEDEAKTKWCPYSNGSRIDSQSLCIASACMMWRLEKPLYAEDVIDGPQHGYCGLAGSV